MKATHILKTTGQEVIVQPPGRTLVSADGTNYNARQTFGFGTHKVNVKEALPYEKLMAGKIGHRVGNTYYIPIVKPVTAAHRLVLIPYLDSFGKEKFHRQVVRANKLKKIK